MDNEFLYPVSVQVNTIEDSDRIRKELDSFGYKTMTFGSNRMPCIIATNVGYIPGKYTNFFSPDINIANSNNRYYCFDNIELFLALAAMRGDGEFYPGEYVISIKSGWGYSSDDIGKMSRICAMPPIGTKIRSDWYDTYWQPLQDIRYEIVDEGCNYYCSDKRTFRKATKEEIINHFSPKSQQNRGTTMNNKDIKVGDKFRVTADIGSRDKKGDIIEVIRKGGDIPTYWYKTINRPETEQSWFTERGIMHISYMEPYVETGKIVGYKLFGVVKTLEEWKKVFGEGFRIVDNAELEPVYEWEVKKGDYLYCHTDLVMDTGTIEATKGRVYISESDNNFTDNSGDRNHQIGSSHLYKYFRPATIEEIKTFRKPIVVDGHHMEIAKDGTFGFGCRKGFTYQDAISYQKLLEKGLTIQSPNDHDIDIELLDKIINQLLK